MERILCRNQNKRKKSENKKAAASNVDTGGGGEIDVGRLDLRVGRILKATKHPDADALYVEEIDLGEEKPRTVVSGLVRFVPLEEMQNRLVVCLCNLKPAKMRGVESQAMVMCASTPEKVEILEIDSSCEPGDVVMCEPFAHRPDLPFMNPKKKIWEGVAPDLSVSENGECVYKGHQLRVFRNGSSLKARTLSNVPVK
uniref:tRNA-binding domain-containing protein n=1 Tax=Meloidogyne incognita TaxID=6306 RepID=A0A914L814_MELIC